MISFILYAFLSPLKPTKRVFINFKKIGLAGLVFFAGWGCCLAHAALQFETTPPQRPSNASADLERQEVIRKKKEESNKGLLSSVWHLLAGKPEPIDLSNFAVDWTHPNEIKFMKTLTLDIEKHAGFFAYNLKLLIHSKKSLTKEPYNSYFNWIMFWAIELDDPAIIKDFINLKGVDPNMTLNTSGIIKHFIHLKGVKPNMIIRNTGSLLHQAAAAWKLNSMKALIAAGADVNIKNANGAPPLLLAVADRNLVMVKELIAQGADPNIKFTFTWALYEEEFRKWGFNPDLLLRDQNKLMSLLDFILFIKSRRTYFVDDLEAAFRAAGGEEFHKPVKPPSLCRRLFSSGGEIRNL